MNNDDLDTLDDAKLSEVFAMEVAGWIHGQFVNDWWRPGSDMVEPVPPFATDANAVLPYLEKYPDIGIDRRKGDGWQCAILSIERDENSETEGTLADAWEDTLARAICVALIKAKRKASK